MGDMKIGNNKTKKLPKHPQARTNVIRQVVLRYICLHIHIRTETNTHTNTHTRAHMHVYTSIYGYETLSKTYTGRTKENLEENIVMLLKV